jgi:hypothetical protein
MEGLQRLTCARCGCDTDERPSPGERHGAVCLECLTPSELRQVARDVDRLFAAGAMLGVAQRGGVQRRLLG